MEGLILFCGDDKYKDFLSLELRGGTPEFHFDVGAGTAIIRGKKSINDGKWHTVSQSIAYL